MFSVYGRKIKLLEVKRILEEQTDEEHCLTAGQISQQLKAVGIPAARKAIYDDIKAINHFYQPKKKGGKAPHIELDENGEVSFVVEEEPEYVPGLYGTFWALVPPIVAILLALITKEVYMSLFIGILSAALLYANFSPVATTEAIFEVMISKLGEARIMDNCKVWNDENEFGE